MPVVLLVAAALLLAAPSPAAAVECDVWSGWGRLASNDDLHNAALFGAAAGLVWGVTDPPSDDRWSGRLGIDRGLRNTFARGTRSGRDDSDDVSDALLVTTLLAPLVVDAGVRQAWRAGDCDRALDLTAEFAEAVTLTMLLTETTKVIAGRERPYARECAEDPGYNSDCDDDDENASFFSGHSSLAAAGAGLLCRNSVRRKLWGDGFWHRALPCALGVGGAVATGIYRMRADEHYFSDVATGLLVGGAIGLFDFPAILQFGSGLGGAPASGLGFAGRRRGPGALILPSFGRSHLGVRLMAWF